MAMRLDLLSILIVEDVAPMRQLLMAILSALGVGTILSAASGDEGFDIFCNETPDIVITDWHMEPGDGIELTQKIRTSPLSARTMRANSRAMAGSSSAIKTVV